MTPVETQIKAALIILFTGIKESDGKMISAAMERLENLLESGRAGLDPQLAHFLERRSYNKALLLLGGGTDIPAGGCGGRPGQG
jgi:hypothetical protein